MYAWGMVWCLILLTWVQGVVAQTLEGEFKGWRVYTLERDGQTTCYLSSSPTDKTGSAQRRSIPYFLVTYRDAQLSEISVSAGYVYLPKSSVSLAIDGKHKYELFTSDKTPEIAWARDSAEDRKIIEGMSQGNKVTVAGKGLKKAVSMDVYALSGFDEAHQRMQELCQKAPDKAAKPGRGQQTSSTGASRKETKKDGPKTRATTGASSKDKASKASPASSQTSKASPVKGRESSTSPAKSNESKASPVRSNESKASPVRSNESKASPVRSNESKASPIKSKESKASPVRSNEGKTSPVKSNDTKNR